MSARICKAAERLLHQDHQITMHVEKLWVAINGKSRLEVRVKILKEKYDNSLDARERDAKISEEWLHNMGE